MNIQGNEKRSWLQDQWFLLVIALLLVLRCFFWFSPTHAEKMSIIYLWPTVIASITLLLYTRRHSLPKGTALTLGMVVWLYVGTVLNGDPYLELNRIFMLGILTSFVGCYLAISTLPTQRREGCLRLLSGLYAALMLTIALLGIYAVIAGIAIRTPFSDAAIRVEDARLYVFQYHPNEIGSAFVIALYIMIYFALSSYRLLPKLLAALGGLVLYVAISLTVSRTSMMLAAAGCGVCAFWLAYQGLQHHRAWARWAVGGLALALVTGIVYLGCIQTIRLAGFASEKAIAANQPSAAESAVSPKADAPTAQPKATPAAGKSMAAVVRIDEASQNNSDNRKF